MHREVAKTLRTCAERGGGVEATATRKQRLIGACITTSGRVHLRRLGGALATTRGCIGDDSTAHWRRLGGGQQGLSRRDPSRADGAPLSR